MSIRVPRFGRDMCFFQRSAEVRSPPLKTFGFSTFIPMFIHTSIRTYIMADILLLFKVLVAAMSNEVYRLNLELVRQFLQCFLPLFILSSLRLIYSLVPFLSSSLVPFSFYLCSFFLPYPLQGQFQKPLSTGSSNGCNCVGE